MKPWIFVLGLTGVSAWAASDWKDLLESTIKADIQFTKFGDRGSLATIGSKYTLTVENIQAMPTAGFTANINVVEGGARREANVGQRLVTGLINTSTRKTQGMQIEPNTKVGILKVNVAKDSVAIQIVTLKAEKVTLRGNTQSEYLYTWLQFPFRDLETMEAAAVKQAIYSVIVPENARAITGTTLSPAGTGPPLAPQNLASEPKPAKSASATSSATAQLTGKTLDEIKTLLGPPNTTLEVSGQLIYVYSELGIRVSFRDGKVIGAQ